MVLSVVLETVEFFPVITPATLVPVILPTLECNHCSVHCLSSALDLWRAVHLSRNSSTNALTLLSDGVLMETLASGVATPVWGTWGV